MNKFTVRLEVGGHNEIWWYNGHHTTKHQMSPMSFELLAQTLRNLCYVFPRRRAGQLKNT